MNALVVLSLAVAAALAEPRPGYLGATTYAAGLGIHAAPLTLPAASVLAPSVSSQFHAQDELGQYHYGYSGGPSAKEEIRTADGSVAGAYSYVDAHGIVQSAHYVSDPVNGFRVAATNLPVGPAAPAPAVVAAAPAVVADSPEVAAAKAAHFNAHLAAKAAVLGRKKRSPGFLNAAAPAAVLSTPAATALAAPVAYAAPTVAVAPARSFAYSAVAAHGAQVVPAGPVAAYAAAAPVVAAAPAAHVVAAAPAAVAYSAPAAVTYSAPAAVAYSAPAHVAYSAPAAAAAVLPVAASSQYRVQDELGQYTYGYADGNSAKTESRAADGSTVGGYSYVDGHGLVQSVKYHADALGFRVAATNLPVGPA